jgi:exopolysaccharide production protein ExoQ
MGWAPDVMTPDPAALGSVYNLNTLTAASNGDTLRQLAYSMLFVVTAWAVYRAQGARALLNVSPMLLVVLGWCWLSTSWAIDPNVSVRRISFTTILVLTASWIALLVPFETVVRCLVMTLTIFILADWVSVMVFPYAVHQPSGLDKALVGDWRGLQSHKNEAGAMCAIALIIFVYEAIRLRSYLSGFAMIVVTAVFLYETHSKTSGAMVVLGVIAGGLVQAGHRRPIARNVVLALMTAGILVCLTLYGQQIGLALATVLDDPTSLTGRTEIWSALTAYAADHPLRGAGYGSFFAIGKTSPIFQYGSGWVTGMDHAHNGYLDLLVQIGGVGVVLVVYTLIVRPFYWLLFKPIAQPGARRVIAAIFTFVCLHDLLETSLMDRATSTWVVMLIMYCLLERLVQPIAVTDTREAAAAVVPDGVAVE